MDPNLFAAGCVITDHALIIVSLFLGHQVRVSDCKRRPGWTQWNAPYFLGRLAVPVGGKLQTTLAPIPLRAAEARPLR